MIWILLNKKCEYGFMAMQYLARNCDVKCCSVKEMAEFYNVSFELLSKIMTKLTKSGLVASYRGIKGGFTLSRNPQMISLGDVITAIDDKNGSFYSRSEKKLPYSQSGFRLVHRPIFNIYHDLNKYFGSISIYDLTYN